MTRQGSTIDIDDDSHRNKKAKRKDKSQSAVGAAHPPLGGGAQPPSIHYVVIHGDDGQQAEQPTPAHSSVPPFFQIPDLQLPPQAPQEPAKDEDHDFIGWYPEN